MSENGPDSPDPAMQERLSRLEQRLARLEAHLGIAPEGPVAQPSPGEPTASNPVPPAHARAGIRGRGGI